VFFDVAGTRISAPDLARELAKDGILIGPESKGIEGAAEAIRRIVGGRRM
jgi:hypothetical protein